ncbi:MAG: hydantoinase [Planctomycetota bacterium]|nr:MAG: hydantoinase [Planctomycetota bacterium]REJ91459.1 MAG: hydantoinase [Planctomycetota bacterium]REK25577.1 MAG: hydantoinase [Planctomycetota bacterium]REK31711.1 MAG: hydantoinase [Planctomycetota bacterium]
MRWQFWIDVGGTFTDCIARSPDGALQTCKVLSSGVTKGRIGEVTDARTLTTLQESAEPDDFWNGHRLRFLDEVGETIQEAEVASSRNGLGVVQASEDLLPAIQRGTRIELSSGEEAPIVAIRRLLRLPLDEPLPPIDVRLGTTRGTNALLERKGARTALITTRGFADVLLIANQDRPRLFDLDIVKPEPLFTNVVEIDERLDAEGDVLRAPDQEAVRTSLSELRATGVESVAICLLHAFANPDHEALVERIAREVGFAEISTSSRLSPLIKIVSRGDTTTVDAYLNPVLRQYVQTLRNSLEPGGRESSGDDDLQSSLRLMTSAGGLVEADHFVGKDSILSGPAGGVIGFSRVAQRAGIDRAIGFDMGGTSTDVSRFDGTYDLEYETRKAGVRIVAPMLAIETVAAGGGSICRFDGVKLAVGPESGGADPGPACYGRGGPLTVTDVNLALGRILPERFPFPLDAESVSRRLQELCDQIAASPGGVRYAPIELAQGFVDIANANMVRAIRRISVGKGYDPAHYTLVTFGGAGAQHSCAMARLLGIGRILIHPFAGILSAYGMGLADVSRFAERSVLKALNGETLASVQEMFSEMQDALRQQVLAEGVAAEDVKPPVLSLDLRYQGADSALNIVQPEEGDFAEAFETQHEQQYGYRHAGRGIEVVAARVAVSGSLPAAREPEAPLHSRRPEPDETTRTWFLGEPHETAVYFREKLQPGDEIDGPAIICEPTSTVVVDPGFNASLLARGEILIRDNDDSSPAGSAAGPTAAEQAPDPIRLEIFNNLFASVAEQMGVTLQKTSISTNVKERLDFSCAVFDADGNLVCNAPHIPVHLGAMSESVKSVLADNPRMSPGDVFVTNDPYRGGSHLPDVTVVTPVHDAQTGERIFFTASRAHHAEIGGIVPGSMPPFSRNLADEGVLIRNFKLVDGGRYREDELRKLLVESSRPTRNVHDNLADVSAQVAANRTGVRLLHELVDRNTLPVVQAYMQHIQNAAAEKMKMALAELPDGEYALSDALDDGSPIAVKIKVEGRQAVVDFTGTGPVLGTNLNANRAIVTAAVLYVFRCLIREDIPLNSGVLEPVEIILPRCLLNPPADDDPEQCPAVVGGNVETSQRVVDVLLGALQIAAASQGTMNNLTFGDETFGYYETICGGSGATPDSRGADAVHTHMTNTRLTDAEVIERRYPVRVLSFEIRRGSGGAGRNPGGDGIIRRLEFLRPLEVSMLSQRRGPYPPFGLEGGHPGKLGRNLLRRAASGEEIDLDGCFAIEVQPGDILTIETPGGGGYGAPS